MWTIIHSPTHIQNEQACPEIVAIVLTFWKLQKWRFLFQDSTLFRYVFLPLLTIYLIKLSISFQYSNRHTARYLVL